MNEGKVFEQNFRKSIPDDVYYQRLHDSSIGFDIENSTQRFALKSPYDYILYYKGNMYCLELKTTKNKAISYAGSSPMIKQHQIDELMKAHDKGCVAGFILNFRDTSNTYFMRIKYFEYLSKMLNKNSFNEKDLQLCPYCIVIPSKKLKVNYRYDLGPMLGR
ncbi:MAG: Penicillin-binding protein-related factor putative recombinase [Lachnospiraceae bacterium]|jgi:recombination protein U|nr:Penicillin-binding protein-related factor putative recombinase [Lachnospiraceae bacterium]